MTNNWEESSNIESSDQLSYSNCESLVSEATALPCEPQPLPPNCIFLNLGRQIEHLLFCQLNSINFACRLNCFIVKLGHPQPLFLFSSLFQKTYLKNQSVQCPYSIWCRDFKPRPAELESPHMATRTGFYAMFKTRANMCSSSLYLFISMQVPWFSLYL